MNSPFTMQYLNREAIVTGSKVHIFTLKKRNKKKPVELSEWPETDMCDPLKAFNVGFLWTLKGCIDDDLIRH